MAGGAATGVMLPSRELIVWHDGDLRATVDWALEAEAAGFDSVWFGDSLLARPRGDPLTLLAAAAAVTNRVRVGTSILLPLLRSPVLLAHSLATLDRIAGGRLVVGVGPGAEIPGTHAELAAVGAPSDRRVSRLVEAVARVRSLWRNEADGIDLEPRPVRPDGPPVWLGGSGPRMLRLTGQAFDGWLPTIPTPAAYAAGLAAVREAAASAGRDPDRIEPGILLTVAVAETSAAAEAQLDQYIRGYYGVPVDILGATLALHAGTFASAAEWFAGYREAGARHLVLRLARPDLAGYVDAISRMLTTTSIK